MSDYASAGNPELEELRDMLLEAEVVEGPPGPKTTRARAFARIGPQGEAANIRDALGSDNASSETMPGRNRSALPSEHPLRAVAA
jgi:hypothetical protein